MPLRCEVMAAWGAWGSEALGWKLARELAAAAAAARERKQVAAKVPSGEAAAMSHSALFGSLF